MGDPLGRRGAPRNRRRMHVGRKDYAAAFCLVVPTACCTVMAFTGRMSPETYVGFLQVYVPAVATIFFAANVAQKALAARADASHPEA